MVSASNKTGNDNKEDKKGRGASQTNSLSATNGHLSAGTSVTTLLSAGAADTGDEQEKEEVPKRVGKAYQADIPDFQQSSDEQLERCPERALLVWAPNSTLTEQQLEEYLWLAKDKYGYNAEQALGMLFWHRHDLERATSDLANFTPLPDEWTTEDKVLFEQAFMFHGKIFNRIRQMLPDKSIAQLVKYYYLWKKTRQKNSLLDKHCKKHAAQLAALSAQGNGKTESELGSVGDDSERGSGGLDGGDGTGKADKLCNNCTVPTNFLHSTTKGMQCLTCYNHWKRTGSLRPTVGPLKRDRQLIKHKRHPPPGMYINHEDLLALASHPIPPTNITCGISSSSGGGSQPPPITAGSASQHPVIRHVENEVIALKRQVQANKAELSYLRTRVATSGGINGHRPLVPAQRLNAKWSNDELLLAVQGVRQYGRNFKALAEIIGNKSENHVRSFFATYRKRYNLDQALREWEAENSGSRAVDDDTEMETEPSVSASTSRSTAATISNSTATTITTTTTAAVATASTSSTTSLNTTTTTTATVVAVQR
uniref:REST corepressor n=2 Tax=Hirondellea gigas TaxID=1518452 RepID=A0A6A7G242_9CRUS